MASSWKKFVRKPTLAKSSSVTSSDESSTTTISIHNSALSGSSHPQTGGARKRAVLVLAAETPVVTPVGISKREQNICAGNFSRITFCKYSSFESRVGNPIPFPTSKVLRQPFRTPVAKADPHRSPHPVWEEGGKSPLMIWIEEVQCAS